MKNKNLYTKLFTIVLFFFCCTAFSQTLEQREFLRTMSYELGEKYIETKEEAVRIADSLGIPVRKEFEDGRVIEIQRFVDGTPIYYTTYNHGGADLIKSSEVWEGGSAGLSLSGEGQTLGMWDGGATRLSHQEFQDRVIQADDATSLSNHATHVAGTMVAGGVDNDAKGMSYKANLDAYDWNNDASQMSSAAAEGLKVSQHSYGTVTGWSWNLRGDDKWAWLGDVSISATEDYRFGFYNQTARNWDQIANNAPNYLIVKSAGNDRGNGPSNQPVEHWIIENGNWVLSEDIRDLDGGEDGYDCISTTGNAKNIMSVGAVAPTGSMASFSSWGPTDDGRVKPDIVAKGVSVYSSTAGSDNSYSSYSGTSMSGPMISGSIGLLLEHQKNLHGEENPLRSATMKALILHTADEMGDHPGPDYIYGWGLMNTERAAEVMSENELAGGEFNIREFTLNDGQTTTISVTSDGVSPLKATIAWNDPAGTPPSPALNPPDLMLVNDLDMRIEHDNTTYMPWILDPANPSNDATTGDNFRDNIEQILIEEPVGGEVYTITITHKNSLENDHQDFSLIITGITEDNVINPLSFSATPLDHSEIELLWEKNNDGHDVMLAWSPDGAFGLPEDGTVYDPGETIPGGGEVLYRGANESYNHTELEENTTYYYRIFSFDESYEYSSGRDANATTLERKYVVAFDVKNQFDLPVEGAKITVVEDLSEMPDKTSNNNLEENTGIKESPRLESYSLEESRLEVSRGTSRIPAPAGKSDDIGKWLHWDDGENYNSIGLGGGGVFSVASRWPVDDIINYDGVIINSIRVFVNDPVNSATIKVWQGSSATELTEYVSQSFTDQQQDSAWVEVVLDNPYTVDGNLELWFGVEYDDPGDGYFPAGIDETTDHDGKGNMIRLGDGAWEALSGYGLNGDWNLQAYVLAPEIVKHTDANGNASFDLLAGHFLYTVEKDKHQTVEGDFIVVEDDKTIDVLLEVDTHTLTLETEPEEGGLLDGAGEYAEGMTATVTATPNAGYIFAQWKKGEVVLSGNEEFDYTMPGEDVTLTAKFVDEETTLYNVSIDIQPEGTGTTAGQGNYEDGDPVTVEAFGNDGYEFDRWTDYNSLDVTDNPYSFNIDGSDVNLIANFIAIDYELAVEVNPLDAGSISFDPDQDYYNVGDEITLTASPEDGYVFGSWTDEEGTVLGESIELVYTMPARNVTLNANFDPIDYVFAVNIEPLNTGNVILDPDKEFYNVGDVITLEAIPEEGYHFTLWTGDTEYIEGDDFALETITVTMPAKNIVLDANFLINEYTITVESNNTEFGTVDGGGTFEHGQEVTVTATPTSDDYRFVEWTEDGITVNNAGAEYTFTATADRDLMAIFEIDDTFVDVHEDLKLSIFPNPARDKFTIESNDMIKQIRLIDISGQVLKDVTVNEYHSEINVHNLRAGVYFLQVHTVNSVVTERVQVAR